VYVCSEIIRKLLVRCPENRQWVRLTVIESVLYSVHFSAFSNVMLRFTVTLVAQYRNTQQRYLE